MTEYDVIEPPTCGKVILNFIEISRSHQDLALSHGYIHTFSPFSKKRKTIFYNVSKIFSSHNFQ